MNCTDFLAKLTDFFDGQIEPDLLAEVKEHLGTCHHCEVVVNTTRKTIDIANATNHPDQVGSALTVVARAELARGQLDEVGSGHDSPLG